MRSVSPDQFKSAYAQGFLRVGVAAPIVVPTDPFANGQAALELARQAHGAGVGFLLLPELSMTGYAIDDLLHQQALLHAVPQALAQLARDTAELLPVIAVGAPLLWQGRLFNCAVVLHRGEILGVVPKTFLPNYREFYEARQFTPGSQVPAGSTIQIGTEFYPFGTDLLFQATDLPDFTMAIEICEDLWVPVPPSSYAAMAGATVIANLSASNAIIGKSEARHTLCEVQSMRCNAAYLYTAAGYGESTTDLAWDGQSMIYENGRHLGETERFSDTAQMAIRDIDLERLIAERMRNGSLSQNAELARDAHGADLWRRVEFTLNPPMDDIGLRRDIQRFPFVPNDADRLDDMCAEAFAIQSQGLAKRLQSSGINKIVIGVSGGLDSSHALLVAVEAMEQLGLPRSNILAYTLPGFATSASTKSAAHDLMNGLGVTASEIDITAACVQMLEDLDHPFSDGKPQYDVTFENVQAGARTSLLFRLANHNKALVLGTGDLSELALGWCTYGVGDQMSHYNVNASVPKTLIQHLIRWAATRDLYGAGASSALRQVLDTEISPELVPGSGDAPAQITEDFVGPYALQDFNLYYLSRYGLRPSKVAFMAWHTWRDVEDGAWPDAVPEAQRVAYDLNEIRSWLALFLHRFFTTSQFKRSAMPNGPKISSGGSLSPRGDWRMPSDVSAAVWLQELERALPARDN